MGTVFKVTTNGVFTALASFNGTNGSSPYAALTLGDDGNFYGTTGGGGNDGKGTVFQVTTNGVLTTLVSFNGANGAWPGAQLESDGIFYGTTELGGITNSTYPSGMGTVFRLLVKQPLITVQPQSQTGNAGATVTFLVSASSLYPLNYQWQKNGTNLVDGGNLFGAATNTLTITNISDSDAANYLVIVSNSYLVSGRKRPFSETAWRRDGEGEAKRGGFFSTHARGLQIFRKLPAPPTPLLSGAAGDCRLGGVTPPSTRWHFLRVGGPAVPARWRAGCSSARPSPHSASSRAAPRPNTGSVRGAPNC